MSFSLTKLNFSGGFGSNNILQFKPLIGNVQTNNYFKAPTQIGFKPGSLTFSLEGSSDPKSNYFTGVIHHPTMGSGITWGKGYDMKNRTAFEIKKDFLAIGLPSEVATNISKAAGLSGESARKFLGSNKEVLPTLTQEQQQGLFDRIYPTYIDRAKYLATKDDVTKKYGATDWDNLTPSIREVVTDMTYQGVYTPAVRTKIQSAVAANDKEQLAGILENWEGTGYIANRMKDRAQFLRDN